MTSSNERFVDMRGLLWWEAY